MIIFGIIFILALNTLQAQDANQAQVATPAPLAFIDNIPGTAGAIPATNTNQPLVPIETLNTAAQNTLPAPNSQLPPLPEPNSQAISTIPVTPDIPFVQATPPTIQTTEAPSVVEQLPQPPHIATEQPILPATLIDLQQPPSGLAAILAPDQGLPPPPELQGKIIPGAQTPTTNPDEKKDIYLNFDNAELGSFINYIAEIKKLNLIPDKGVDGNKISLTIREPLSADGAWNIFLTVLDTAGFCIVQVGDVHKIVPKDRKAAQPLPAYINIPADKIPDDDSNIRYVMFLTNLQAANLKDLIQSMLSANASLVDVKDVNGLIITDKCYNIKTAVRVIQELDQMGTAETVSVIHLKNANAVDVKSLLDGIIKTPEVSPLARLLGKTSEGTTEFFPPGTRIIPEERTNSLILMGNPKPIQKIEEFIVNHIDTDLQEKAKSPLHVFELQYANAQQIAEILNEVTQGGDTTAGQAASKYGAIRGGVKYFKKMTFKVDVEGNRLIVSSSDKVDWKLLKQTIRDLDKPQPQVAIETLIVTVNLADTKQIGGNIRNKQGKLGTNIDIQSAAGAAGPSLKYTDASKTTPVSLLGDLTEQIVKQQGLSVLTFGGSSDIWSVFQMLKTQTNASVLSQPFVTVANKTKASVTVSTKQRVTKEIGDNGKKGYDDAEAKTLLELTPQINIDGIIRMHIHTEINQFENDDATQTSERILDTDVTIADGQVLVLGGFVKTKVTESKYKTPLLGDLPLLGWLFKSQKRELDKQYLFIFLSPTIIKPRQQPGMGLYTKMKLHNVTDSIENSVETKQTPDPVHNWFFNPEKENYSHKVIDFANARYQPTTVDIKNDPYYRAQTIRAEQTLEEPLTSNNKQNIPLKELVPTPEVTPAQPTPVVIAQQSQEPSVTTSTSTQTSPTPLQTMPSVTPANSDNLSANTIEEKRQETKNVLSINEPVATPTISSAPPLIPSQVIQEPAQVKREQLKEFITTPPTPVTQEQQTVINNSFPQQLQEKRFLFKENLTPPIKTTPRSQPGNELNVDLNRRNSLKNFIANNPAFARNNVTPTRRATT